MITWKSLLTFIENTKDCDQRELKNFQKNAAEDLCFALTWSKELFERAAIAQFSRVLQSHVDHALTVADVDRDEQARSIFQYYAKEVARKAKYPEQSTSPTSNLMERYQLAARASFVEKFTDY